MHTLYLFLGGMLLGAGLEHLVHNEVAKGGMMAAIGIVLMTLAQIYK